MQDLKTSEIREQLVENTEFIVSLPAPGRSCPVKQIWRLLKGTNDPFCRLDLLAEVLNQVKAPTRTHLIEGGNHDFRVPKRLGREPEAVWQEVVEAICRWREAQPGGQ